MADTIFEQFATPYWQPKDGAKVFLPLHGVRRSRRKDLAKHKRLHKTGERVDNLGGFSDVYTVTLEYYNGQEHNEAKGRYPDDVEALEDAFDPNDVGELFLPQFGYIQAQFETLERVEQWENPDHCAIQAVWVADAADDDKAATWSTPSSTSVAARFVADFKASTLELGVDGDPLGEIQDFCEDLEGLANAPADFVNAIDGKITRTLAAVKRVEETFSQRASEARSELFSTFSDPAATKVGRQAQRLKDILGAARSETFAASVVTRVYPAQVSVFDVARDLTQPIDRLIQLNSNLPDLMAIAPNTPIRVLSQSQR